MKYADLIENLEFDELEKLHNDEISKQQQKEEFNIFSILHLTEDGHSNLLTWLLNANGKSKNSIQYHFLKEFLKNESLKLSEIHDINDENFLNDFLDNLEIETQHEFYIKDDNNIPRQGRIDIFLHSEKHRYVCVIEVKLDAKICKDKDGVTQIEKYCKFINQKYKGYKKDYIFLCVNENKKLEGLLNKFEYTSIEHSDIVLMLYRTINRNPETLKEDNFIINLVKQYIEYWEVYNEFNGGYSKILDIEKNGNLYEVFAWDVNKKMNDAKNQIKN